MRTYTLDDWARHQARVEQLLDAQIVGWRDKAIVEFRTDQGHIVDYVRLRTFGDGQVMNPQRTYRVTL